jgi:hypothetical protein
MSTARRDAFSRRCTHCGPATEPYVLLHLQTCSELLRVALPCAVAACSAASACSRALPLPLLLLLLSLRALSPSVLLLLQQQQWTSHTRQWDSTALLDAIDWPGGVRKGGGAFSSGATISYLCRVC